MLAGRVNYNSIGVLLSRQCCDESMKICYEAIKAGVKLLLTSFLYAVGREDNSRYFVLKCLPEPITTTLSEKTLISRGIIKKRYVFLLVFRRCLVTYLWTLDILERTCWTKLNQLSDPLHIKFLWLNNQRNLYLKKKPDKLIVKKALMSSNILCVVAFFSNF